MKFRDWLKNSSESADLREAFTLIENMPQSLNVVVRGYMMKLISDEAQLRWGEIE